MPDKTDRPISHAPVRWPLFAVLAIVAVVISLLTARLGQASAGDETTLPAGAVARSASTGVLTDTQVFLPIVTACRLQGISLAGPAEPDTIGLTQTFTVAVAAPGITLPLTYTWHASDLAAVTHSGGLTDTIDLAWQLTGNKWITVAVSNGGCTVPVTVALDLTTRGLIVFEEKTSETFQHDLMLVHNEHPGAFINLTNTPDLDEGAPTWSPDGNWIAYSAGDPHGGNRSIYKIDLGTRQVYSITDETTNDRWPAWSPDGTQIAFMRDAGPDQGYMPDIYVMDVDGSNVQQLTDWLYGDEYPAWSPDGESIAFVSDRYYAGRDLWLMDADGGNQRQALEKNGTDEVYPTWGPEGWIYYTYRLEEGKTELLYRFHPDTGEDVEVFDDDYNRYIASFAPDGQCFSFYSILGEMAGTDKEVWKWCDGYTRPVNLTDNDVSDEYSAWSPVP